MAPDQESKKQYLYYIKIYSYLLENNLVFCFVEGITVSKEECEVFFNKLFVMNNFKHAFRRKQIYSYNEI